MRDHQEEPGPVVPQQGPQQDRPNLQDVLLWAKNHVEAMTAANVAPWHLLRAQMILDRLAALSASRIDPPVWTEQDWLTLDRIEQTLTTMGAITADDAHWLIEHLVTLAKVAARIDPRLAELAWMRARQQHYKAFGIREHHDAEGFAGTFETCVHPDCVIAKVASRIDPPVPSPRLTDLQHICNLNAVQAIAVKGYIERWLAVSSSSVADPSQESTRQRIEAALRSPDPHITVDDGLWLLEQRDEWIARFNKLPEIVARAEERGRCQVQASSSVADSPTIVLPTKAEVEAEGFEAVPVDDEPSASSASAEAGKDPR